MEYLGGMFSVVLAKLLPERHNLYGNSLDFKLNIYKKKIYFYFQLLFLRQGNSIYFLPSSCFQTRSPRHPNVIFFILLSKDKTQVPGIPKSFKQPLANSK